MTISSVSISQGLNNSLKISTQRSLWSPRHQGREMLCHTSIDISNGNLVCPIFDKRDAFDFDIVNFNDLSGNIPTAPAYGTYISQLVRYNHRACHNYENFSSRNSMLVERLFHQGFFCKKTDENILQIYG